MNDNAYGMIQSKHEDLGFKNYGLDYGNPDFVKYAESFGADGYKPDSVEEFQQTFKKVLNLKGVHLIDLAIDYSLNHEILNLLLKKYSSELKK